MAAFYVNTGQLDPETVAAWWSAGGDEHGFYQLGTEASYGSGWELGSWSQDPDQWWSL